MLQYGRSFKDWNPELSGMTGEVFGYTHDGFNEFRFNVDKSYRWENGHLWELTIKSIGDFYVLPFPYELIADSPDMILLVILDFVEDLKIPKKWIEEYVSPSTRSINAHSSLKSFSFTDNQREEVIKRLDRHIKGV